MATIAELEAALTGLQEKVTNTVGVETSAAALLNNLGQLVRDNIGNPAALQAIADGMTNQAGALSTSADSLAAAVAANPVP